MPIEMVLNAVFIILISVLGWLFVDNRNTLRARIDKLEGDVHVIENEKFAQIIETLNGLKTDIAVIKTEIQSLKMK